jgi:hypothetical protein
MLCTLLSNKITKEIVFGIIFVHCSGLRKQNIARWLMGVQVVTVLPHLIFAQS